MDSDQAEEEAIINFEKMMQVAERIMGAAEAVADSRDGAVGLDVLIVGDINVGEPFVVEGSGIGFGEDVEATVAGIAGWHGTIKDGIADVGAGSDVAGMTD